MEVIFRNATYPALMTCHPVVQAGALCLGKMGKADQVREEAISTSIFLFIRGDAIAFGGTSKRHPSKLSAS